MDKIFGSPAGNNSLSPEAISNLDTSSNLKQVQNQTGSNEGKFIHFNPNLDIGDNNLSDG